jgi:hypothetical protein
MDVDSTFASLKEEKEAFITGYNGTSAIEVILVCSAIPTGS